jgi:hypothetical protein
MAEMVKTPEVPPVQRVEPDAAVVVVVGMAIYLVRAWRGREWPFAASTEYPVSSAE